MASIRKRELVNSSKFATAGKQTSQNVSVESTDADGEWSDESTDVNTDSPSEGNAQQKNSSNKKADISKPPNKAATKLPVLNLKAADDLMDKIDAEISTFTVPVIVPSPVVTKKPPKYQPLKLSINTQLDHSATKSPVLSKVYSDNSKDTGLGTASLSIADDMDQQNGQFSNSDSSLSDPSTGKIYGESEELDSDAAINIDKKYQEIMKKKTGTLHKKLLKKRLANLGSDTESIRTEDFVQQFQQTIVNPTGSKGAKAFRAKSKGHAQARRSKHHGGASDLESTRTEDFETAFQTLMVKHVAGVPLTGFDCVTIDSDLDTVRSTYVHEKFQEALTSSPYKLTYENSDNSSVEDESCGPKVNGFSDGSDAESIEATAGSPQRIFQNRAIANLKLAAQQDEDGSHSETEMMDSNLEDGEIDISEEARQIEEESASIQRQMELERKAKQNTGKTMVVNQVICEKDEVDSNHETISINENEEQDISMESQHIELESEQIQHELELERKAKLMSTPKMSLLDSKMSSSTPNLSVIPKHDDNELSRRKLELHELNESVKLAKDDKKTLLKDLKTLQESIKRMQKDIKLTEKQAKDNRGKAEEERSQLMLVEFKKNSSSQDLEKLKSDVLKKKQKLKDVEASLKKQENELRAYQSLGLSKEQVLDIMEEYKQLQAKLRNVVGIELERNELERQLDATKDELFNEQKRSRAKAESVEEDLDATQQRLEEALLDRESSLEKVQQLENKYKQLEKKNIEIGREKSRELENLREKHQNDMFELRLNLSKEMGEIKDQLQLQTDKVAELQADVNHKDELNIQLRNQLIEVQHELTKEVELKDSLAEDHQRNMQKIRNEMDGVKIQQKEAALVEKQQALEVLRAEMEQERVLTVSNLEDSMTQQLVDYQQALHDKEVELDEMQERLQQQQESVKRQIQEKVKTVLAKERENWMIEKDDYLKKELSRYQAESVKALAKLQEELEKERQTNDTQAMQITVLNQELEEQRQQTRQAYKDKMAALTKAKDKAREENIELGKMKEQWEEDKQEDLENLHEELRKQKEENLLLKAERQRNGHKDREGALLAERIEKMVVTEANEECRRIACILEVTPRKVNIASFKSEMNSPGKSPMKGLHVRSPSRTPTTAALANLRACNEELRNNVKELKQEVEAQKQALIRMEQSKERSVDEMRQKFQNDKNKELTALRERLIKEHLEEISLLHRTLAKDKSVQQQLKTKDDELREIHCNMKKWKEDTADKLARKFEEELNRELEKKIKDQQKKHKYADRDTFSYSKDKDRLSAMNGASNSSFDANDSTLQLLRHLQNRVKQLRLENASLKRSHSISTPDLSSASEASFGELQTSVYGDTYIRSLEKRVKRAEQQAQDAEERAQRNQELLSQKMLELTKLQNTVTVQTKEIMSLEQNNSQLKMKLSRTSPSRTFSSGSSR